MDTAKKKKEKEKNQHQDDRDSTLAKELPDGRSLGEFGWEIENLPSKTFFFFPFHFSSYSFIKHLWSIFYSVYSILGPGAIESKKSSTSLLSQNLYSNV